jgi:hypothetical protein
MLKKITTFLGIAACLSCLSRQPELGPPRGPFFRSLSVKFTYHDGDARQSGRVLWRFDEDRSRFLFFTPMNQVGLELDVAGEGALLVNLGKHTFWRGEFSRLLERMWGVDLTLSALKTLLVRSEAPEDAFAGKGIAVSLEHASGSLVPKSVRLQRGTVSLLLRIQKSEFHAGKIVLIDYTERYREAELESVLEE